MAEQRVFLGGMGISPTRVKFCKYNFAVNRALTKYANVYLKSSTCLSYIKLSTARKFRIPT